MADKELEQLRQQRMAQMESQFVSWTLITSIYDYYLFFFFRIKWNFWIDLLQGGKEADQQKALQDRARQQEDAKNSILSQIMDQDARARCKYNHRWCHFIVWFVEKLWEKRGLASNGRVYFKF